MNKANTNLSEFISEEVKKYQGVMVPIKAGIPEQTVKRKVPCSKLHPNPDDEFCNPQIGPSYKIISEYEKKYRERIFHGQDPFEGEEPLTVQKIKPDGYMILNGHHRWAAAKRIDSKYVPIRIVNISMESDIKNILKKSSRSRRATFDLDEVIFCSGEDHRIEKTPGYLYSYMHSERIRLGVPALLSFLSRNAYDIWVFTSQYYSIDYIRALFRKYNVNVNGIVTGTAKKEKKAKQRDRRLKELIYDHYDITLMIDREAVIFVDHRYKNNLKYDIDASEDGWSVSVMNVVKDLKNVL